MHRDRWARGVTLGITGMLLSGAAQAQGTLEIELLDRGKPIPNAQVSALEVGDLLNQGKPVGTTNSDGLALLDLGKVAFQPGSRIEVWVRTCQGRKEVVLVPAGTTSRCDDDNVPPEARCGCERLGVFIWGPGRLVVDVGTKTVSYRPTGGDGRGRGVRQSIILGGGIGFFPNLDDAVRNQDDLTSFEGSSTGVNLYFRYEIQPTPNLPLVLGAEVVRTQFGQFTQEFAGTSGGPTRNTIDFGRTSVGASAGVQLPQGGTAPFLVSFWLNVVRDFNNVDLESVFDGTTDPVTGSRSESGFRMGGGVGADVRLGRRTGIRATAGYTRGAGKDADTNLSLGVGIRYTFAGRLP